MASTVLASMAIMLSSLIAVLMTNGNKTEDLKPMSSFVFGGDTSQASFSVKYFCILSCFLVAFLLNVQSIRYYSHASILINVPFKKMTRDQHSQELTVDYVARNVNRGSYFWSLGLRAFYFSFPLFLWIFGPIPMFVSCFVLVFLLYFLDITSERKWVSSDDDDGPKDEELGRNN